MSNSIAVAFLVSEIWLAMAKQTDTYTHRQTTWLHFNIFSHKDFENKKQSKVDVRKSLQIHKDFENKKQSKLGLRVDKYTVCMG